MKKFKGLLDSLYKKWELYLLRLFQIAKYFEDQIKFPKISAPPIEEVLNPRGYDGYIRIPPNPFFIRADDEDFFRMFFDDITCDSEDIKAMRRTFGEIWERIGIIKRFLGITRNTRYCGETRAEKRLVNEIDVYLEYPEACSPIHALILGKCPDNDRDMDDFMRLMKQFQNFLLDRDPIEKGDVKSYEQY